VAEVWESLHKLQDHQIAHGDLRHNEITVSTRRRVLRRVR